MKGLVQPNSRIGNNQCLIRGTALLLNESREFGKRFDDPTALG
jgi:hypothetical protein